MKTDLAHVLSPKRPKVRLNRESALSSGSTLLNLACTDRPDVAFKKGGYYYLVGDSSSGKTWTSLSCFAEACLNPAFAEHLLVFDDVEGGAQMDVAHYFGKAVAKRMRPPAYDKKQRPVNSETIEDFYHHIHNLIRAGKPFIYILDSQDSLRSEASDKKFEKKLKFDEEGGEEVKGSFGDGKAKFHSENLRRVVSGLRRTGSILIILGQTRDNLGFSFDPKTRSGGKALKFYANLEIWTSCGKKLQKMVRDRPRTVGVNCLAEVKKNRVTGKVGKDRQVTIPIYYELGIDDIGSMVDYLILEKHWQVVEKSKPVEGEKKSKKKVYDAKELLFKGSRDKIIAYIEEEDLEGKVRDVTATLWKTIEEECAPKRKPRYE